MRPPDATRISALGELATAIAHEITEPLSAIAMNGETSLRWLDRREPNVAKARELLGRIIADACRAAEIVARIQAEASAPPQGPAADGCRGQVS